MTRVLSLVRTLPRGEANIFPEYIFPAITEVAQDEVNGMYWRMHTRVQPLLAIMMLTKGYVCVSFLQMVCVRVAFAENLSSLAESSLRFLELADQVSL